MCLADAVVPSWSLRQEVAGSNPLTVMTNISVRTFSGKLKQQSLPSLIDSRELNDTLNLQNLISVISFKLYISLSLVNQLKTEYLFLVCADPFGQGLPMAE